MYPQTVMRPLHTSSWALGGVGGGVRRVMLATDVDGSLTRGGKLSGDVILALERLAGLGVEVVPVSGRPAGEVLGLCRYLPGVVNAVAENGALWVRADLAVEWLTPVPETSRLRSWLETLNHEHHAGLRRTPDSFCRLADIACERAGRDVDELERIAALTRAAGISCTWSNVHVHFAQDLPDKGLGVLRMVEYLSAQDALDPHAPARPLEIVTFGDALNDIGLFVPGRFAMTVGTADLHGLVAHMPHIPEYVTEGREAEGFLELVAHLEQGMRAT